MSSNKPITIKQQKAWLTLMRIGRKCGCHQLPARSFYYKNFQFPLCARCTGIMIGQFLIAPIILILGFNHLILNLLFLGLMGLDGSLQYFKVLESTNLRRLVSGLIGGYALMSITVLFFKYLLNILF